MAKILDIAVIGGGAAGFFSAVNAGRLLGGQGQITIFEKRPRVLEKVKISGGGRCNVTHDCHEPRALVKHYPRGERSLIGPMNHFGPEDTIAWFGERGVELKVEPDGRMFPITDSSETVINCLMEEADQQGVAVCTGLGVEAIEQTADGYFSLQLSDEAQVEAKCVLLATGGTRAAAGAKLAQGLGHSLHAPVPSLFTFHIEDPRIEGLAGVSVNPVELTIKELKLSNTGPLLITHWGISGPATLKLSSLGARQLSEIDYRFTVHANWCPAVDLEKLFSLKRQEWGKRAVIKRSPLASIPKRLWERFVEAAQIEETTTWSQLRKEQLQQLIAQLRQGEFEVSGKSLNKEEFVTCGGVELKEVNLKTMQSKHCEGLFFAGEVLNIDGITGGFNFQSAWTTGHLAANGMVARVIS